MNPRLLRRWCVGVLVVCGLLLSSCGSGGKNAGASPSADPGFATRSASPAVPDGTVATSAPADPGDGPKSTFVAKANAICRGYIADSAKLGDPKNLSDIPRWLRAFIAILDDLQLKFRALPMPAGDEGKIDGYLDGNDEQTTALRQALPEVDAGARANDEQRVNDALGKAFTTFDRIAKSQEPFVRSYGLVDCGEEAPGQTTA